MSKAKNVATKWWLIVVLLLAFGARVYRIDNQSFWNDEGNSASLSSRSVALILEGTASDVHPPLYYLLLRGWWPLAGQSDLALRLISAVAGVIQVAATIAIGRMWLSRHGAIAVGLLVAVSPPLIYYSQEARMYALLGAISTVSMLVLLQGLGARYKQPVSRFRLSVIAFSILTILGLYTHYVYPAVLVAQGIIVLLLVASQAGRVPTLQTIFNKSWPWLIAVLMALIVYAPWLPIFLKTGSSTRDVGSAGAADFLFETGFWLVGGPFARLGLSGWVYTLFIALFIIGLVASIFQATQKHRFDGIAALIWLFVPILLMLVVGATDENYRKFLTVVVPALWLVVMMGLERIKSLVIQAAKRSILPISIGIALLLAREVRMLYTNPETFRDDYRGIATLIKQENRPNAAVILNAPNQWEVFSWYAGEDEAQTLYPLPKSRRPDAEIKQEVEAVLATHDFVYVLFWGFEGFDPNRMVERTLDEQAFKSTDGWYGDVRLVTYGVLGDFLPSETNRPDLEVNQEFFHPDSITGSGVELNWVEVSGADFRPGDVIGLAFEWEALREIDGRYKVFIHLLNENGQLVAQRDAEPVGNLKPTDGWQMGETILDQHGLLIPAGTPAGSYTLLMGLYDVYPPNNRLLVSDSPADIVAISSSIIIR